MSFPLKTNPDGTENTDYVDLLQVSTAPENQTYALVAFQSPENILKQKDMYFMDEFVKEYGFRKNVESFSIFMSYIAAKYNLKPEALNKDFVEFINDDKDELMSELSIERDYKEFLQDNENSLTTIFENENDFQTTVQSIKVMCVTDDQFSQEFIDFRNNVEEHPTVTLGTLPVGVWNHWDPTDTITQYAEEQANFLFKKNIEKEEARKRRFELNTKNKIKAMITENKQNAAKTGNKLIQDLDENGLLVKKASGGTVFPQRI